MLQTLTVEAVWDDQTAPPRAAPRERAGRFDRWLLRHRSPGMYYSFELGESRHAPREEARGVWGLGCRHRDPVWSGGGSLQLQRCVGGSDKSAGNIDESPDVLRFWYSPFPRRDRSGTAIGLPPH